MKKYQIAKLVGSFIISTVVFLFLFADVFAQQEPEILPDDPLYKAKQQMETAQLNAGLDPLETATLHTEYAKERLAEVKAMISKGKPEFVNDLLKDYEKAINGAMDEINRAQAQGRDVSEALKAVEISTTKHTEVLTSLFGEVPEQAKPAIAHAIEVSNRTMDVLNEIQKSELSVGRPEVVGETEKHSEIEGIGRLGGTGSPSGGFMGGSSGGGFTGGSPGGGFTGGSPGGRGR